MGNTPLQEKKIQSVLKVIPIVSIFINAFLWYTLSLYRTQYLNFGKNNIKLLRALEIIAAVFSIVSLLAALMAVYLYRNNTNLASHKQNKSSKKHIKELNCYFEIAAISVLSVMQVLAAFDIYFDLGINRIHEKIGLVFDIQTIVDTIGLGMLFISLIINTLCAERTLDNKDLKTNIKSLCIQEVCVNKELLRQINSLCEENSESEGFTEKIKNLLPIKYNNEDDFVQAVKKAISDDKNKQNSKFNYICSSVRKFTPVLAIGLILLGKIFMGLESSKKIHIPINDGKGIFPLALTMRLSGLALSFIILIMDLNTNLNEVSSVNSAILSTGVIAGGT